MRADPPSSCARGSPSRIADDESYEVLDPSAKARLQVGVAVGEPVADLLGRHRLLQVLDTPRAARARLRHAIEHGLNQRDLQVEKRGVVEGGTVAWHDHRGVEIAQGVETRQ